MLLGHLRDDAAPLRVEHGRLIYEDHLEVRVHRHRDLHRDAKTLPARRLRQWNPAEADQLLIEIQLESFDRHSRIRDALGALPAHLLDRLVEGVVLGLDGRQLLGDLPPLRSPAERRVGSLGRMQFPLNRRDLLRVAGSISCGTQTCVGDLYAALGLD